MVEVTPVTAMAAADKCFHFGVVVRPVDFDVRRLLILSPL